jgi:hypothetical protein
MSGSNVVISIVPMFVVVVLIFSLSFALDYYKSLSLVNSVDNSKPSLGQNAMHAFVTTSMVLMILGGYYFINHVVDP